jgi:DNA-binding response OmpR family regulator
VVEDDPDLRTAVASGLRRAGLAVDTENDTAGASSAVAVTDYDCIVLDRGLPDGDGASLVSAIRNDGRQTPVLFLTARDSVASRLEGFAAGGDDYVVKPFALEEVIARVRSLCRRAAITQPSRLEIADLVLDRSRAEVFRDGVLLPLTAKELAILEVLMTNADCVVSRSLLIERCWDDATDPMSNVVDVHVGSLRRKLGEPSPIKTVRGQGFLFAAHASESPEGDTTIGAPSC